MILRDVKYLQYYVYHFGKGYELKGKELQDIVNQIRFLRMNCRTFYFMPEQPYPVTFMALACKDAVPDIKIAWRDEYTGEYKDWKSLVLNIYWLPKSEWDY